MLDTLHPAVLDRMEIIEIAGYTHAEKRHILDSYLLPEAIQKAGLSSHMDQFDIPPSIRDFIIVNYAREAGVRSLKRYINKICEKIAFKLVEDPDCQKVVIGESNVEDFLGSAVFSSKKIYKQQPPGVVVGLAYNAYGGGILYIEAN